MRNRTLILVLAGAAGILADAGRAMASEASAIADTLGMRDEEVVVTASRREQTLGSAPAAVSVFDARQITQAPVDDYGDLVRLVPGANVAQTSALDLSISTRNATGVLPQGQLALVDNRFVYQDYNNFVLWTGVPVELEEIDRVEVLRGPGSAMWGANAADGVIHIITKRPRESAGTILKAGGGELGSAFASAVHTGVSGDWSYRVSGGWVTQDPYDQAEGTIPGTEGPANPDGTPYPAFDAVGLDVYRGSARVDYEVSPTTSWSASGGYATFRGTFLTPAGPYRYMEGTYTSFGKIDFQHDSLRATLFSNVERSAGFYDLGPEAPVIDPDIAYETINLDVTDSRPLGPRHLLTYGATGRYSHYDIGLGPTANDRKQYGAFLEDDISITERLRLVAGARWDHVDVMGDALSPRVSLMLSPSERHQLRLSYNRAFLAPSILENHFDVPQAPVIIPLDTPNGPYDLVFNITYRGSLDLEEEKLDAFEVAWTGQVTDEVRLSVSAYRNEFKDSIQIAPVFYTSNNPPESWPDFLPVEILDVPPPDGFGGIPEFLQLVNVGSVTHRGIEISGDARVSSEVSLFVNYSWQDAPQTKDFPLTPLPNGTLRPALNEPPRNRVNGGVAYDRGDFFANGSVSYQSLAFWTDISDFQSWGPTDAFTQVNAGAGVRFDGGRIVWSLNAQNLFDADAQQHVWGEIIGRKITSQVVVRF